MGLVVTIGGPHGTGKSTYAKMIARQFKLRYVSAGQLFRDLAKEKDEERVTRIANRDRLNYEAARRQTLERERIQRERYQRYYGINIDDLSLYNIVIDTGSRSVESTCTELMSRIHEILRQNNPARNAK
jgi:cytidylate kinase